MKLKTEGTHEQSNLLSDEDALNAVFDGSRKPSIRVWREWRKLGYYSYVRIGRSIWIDPEKVREELEKKFTVHAD